MARPLWHKGQASDGLCGSSYVGLRDDVFTDEPRDFGGFKATLGVVGLVLTDSWSKSDTIDERIRE